MLEFISIVVVIIVMICGGALIYRKNQARIEADIARAHRDLSLLTASAKAAAYGF
jgi:Mn2+/Fe2+ NRAMP family transporter